MSRTEIPRLHEPTTSHNPYRLRAQNFDYHQSVELTPSPSPNKEVDFPSDLLRRPWKLYRYADSTDDPLWIAVADNSLGAREIDQLSMYIAPFSMEIQGVIDDFEEMLDPSLQDPKLSLDHYSFHPYYWQSLLRTHLPPFYQTYNQHPDALEQYYNENGPVTYLQGVLSQLREAQLQKNAHKTFTSTYAQQQVSDAEKMQEEQLRHLRAMGYRDLQYYYPEESQIRWMDYYLYHQNGSAIISSEGKYRKAEQIAEAQYLTPVLPFRIVGDTIVPDLEAIIPDEIVGLSKLPSYTETTLVEDPYERDPDHDMIELLAKWDFNIHFKPSTLLGIYALIASSPQACETIWETQGKIAGQFMTQAQLPLLALLYLEMVTDSPTAQQLIEATKSQAVSA